MLLPIMDEAKLRAVAGNVLKNAKLSEDEKRRNQGQQLPLIFVGTCTPVGMHLCNERTPKKHKYVYV